MLCFPNNVRYCTSFSLKFYLLSSTLASGHRNIVYENRNVNCSRTSYNSIQCVDYTLYNSTFGKSAAVTSAAAHFFVTFSFVNHKFHVLPLEYRSVCTCGRTKCTLELLFNVVMLEAPKCFVRIVVWFSSVRSSTVLYLFHFSKAAAFSLPMTLVPVFSLSKIDDIWAEIEIRLYLCVFA